MVAQVYDVTWQPMILEPEPPTLGQTIRRLRGSRTQDEVARAMGVGQNAVTKWERDAGLPADDKISALERYFGLGPDELFDVRFAHEKWERIRKTLPGVSVAVPHDPVLVRLLTAVGQLDERRIEDLAREVEQILARPAQQDETRDAG